MPSASVHARAAKTATRLIAKNGRTLFLLSKHSTTTEAPASKPWNSGGTNTFKSAAAIIGVQRSFKSHEVDGDLVRSADKEFLIDSRIRIDTSMRIEDHGLGLGLLPLNEWRAGIDAFGVEGRTLVPIKYSIVAVNEVKPGQTSIMYKVQVRI